MDNAKRLTEAKNMIDTVQNCLTGEEKLEIDEHYDCREDLEKAIAIIQEVKTNL